MKCAIFLAFLGLIVAVAAFPRPDDQVTFGEQPGAVAAEGDDEGSNRHRYWGYRPSYGYNSGYGGYGGGFGGGYRPSYGYNSGYGGGYGGYGGYSHYG